MGPHIFIFIYILAFVLGIATITANWALSVRKKDVIYRKLQWLYVFYSIHTLINFSYFYRNYFIEFWEWRIFIFTIINISLVLFVFSGIEVLAGILKNDSAKRQLPILLSGVFYIICYTAIRWQHIGVNQVFHGVVSTILFVGSNLLFALISFYYIWKYFSQIRKRREMTTENRRVAGIISVTITCYLICNFSLDTYFGMISDRGMIFGINVFHMFVLIYLSMNLAFLLCIYRRHLSSQKQEFIMEGEEAENEVIAARLLKLKEVYQLTPREIELIELVYAGKSNPEIASILYISENTVKHHLSNIYRKMHVNSRFELIKAIRP